MTIRIEREALLRVISTSPSTTATPFASSSCNPCIRDEDEFVIVDSIPMKPLEGNDFFYRALTEDDDQASLCTLSTSSVSSYDSSCDISTVGRRVSFASQLVTDVWTREKTLPEDISNLYYSSQQTQTFRQEYRLERKVLNELSMSESFPVDDEELSNLMVATTSSTSSSSNSSRHHISRVVVLHNDKLETFFNPSDSHLLPEKDQIQPLTTYSLQANSSSSKGDSSSSDFFDNDSFWSGSLTWY